jgi:hypothetical protein
MNELPLFLWFIFGALIPSLIKELLKLIKELLKYRFK